jgi:hypothetical protein
MRADAMGRFSRALFLGLACLLLSSLVALISPASAASSSLTPEERMIGWRGDKMSGSIPDPSKCRREKCGSYYFSVNIPESYWDHQRGSLAVRISWIEADDDFDLYLYRGKKLIGSSRRRGSTSESVWLRQPRPGTYRALLVPVRVRDSGYGAFARLKVKPPPPGTPYFPAPSSIRSDCSRDVTSKLQKWIASVPDHSTLSFNRGGCYRIDGSLLIEDRWGLTFQGNGATFKAMTDGDQKRRHFWIKGGGNWAFQNLVVIGANPNAGLDKEAWRPDRAFQHAFALQGVQGAVLDNVRAYDVYGDFVNISRDGRRGDGPWSRNVIVQNSTFERNGRQGLSIGAGENITIQWNYVGEVRLTTFDIETLPGLGARGIHFSNNVTGRGKHHWLANWGAGHDISDINIVKNIMIFPTGLRPVRVKTPPGGLRGPYYIADNDFVVHFAPAGAFGFAGATNVIVAENHVVFLRRGTTAVTLLGSHHVRVIGNHFQGAARILTADKDSSDYFERDNET